MHRKPDLLEARGPAPTQASGEKTFPIAPVATFGLALFVAILCGACSPSESKGPTAKPEAVEAADLKSLEAKAEGGDAVAQHRLGVVYAKGQTVKQDYKQAAKWYRLAADQGLGRAQSALGELYETGQGVPQDDAEAAKWYRRAADQGDIPGQYSLAILYVLGKGVPQSQTEAFKWYQRAAEQGDSLSQYNLGVRYTIGQGVTADPVEAFKWLSLAAAQGLPDADKARSELKSKMTGDQVAEGKRRIAAFVVKQGSPTVR